VVCAAVICDASILVGEEVKRQAHVEAGVVLYGNQQVLLTFMSEWCLQPALLHFLPKKENNTAHICSGCHDNGQLNLQIIGKQGPGPKNQIMWHSLISIHLHASQQ
jgi:hypothetical protein